MRCNITKHHADKNQTCHTKAKQLKHVFCTTYTPRLTHRTMGQDWQWQSSQWQTNQWDYTIDQGYQGNKRTWESNIYILQEGQLFSLLCCLISDTTRIKNYRQTLCFACLRAEYIYTYTYPGVYSWGEYIEADVCCAFCYVQSPTKTESP